MTPILVVVAVWSVLAVLIVRLRYRPSAPPKRVVLRPIVIPARYGYHTFTDAEVIERFLTVDLMLAGEYRPGQDW